MSVILNNKERFATNGIRFQRHNGDGTIPTPQRFLGFANNVNLSAVLTAGKAPLTIKLDALPSETKDVDFSGASDPARVTVAEAIAALSSAAFTGCLWSQDAKTTRLLGSYTPAASLGTKGRITVRVTNTDSASHNIAAHTYSFSGGDKTYACTVAASIPVPAGDHEDLVFEAGTIGLDASSPLAGADITAALSPALQADLTAELLSVIPGSPERAAAASAKIIQVTGPLAAALDFGQSLKHGGLGLKMLSFFDDETISIGLPKDIKDKEEIDIEGARGTITRMVIGSMLQGMSPVVTLHKKDYDLLELVQGGKLNREQGTYDPPLSGESEHPTFYAEIFSSIYSGGSNSDASRAGYEKLLLRSMIGMEGDVPIEAKAWANYAFNLTATEYKACIDGTEMQLPAYQEQTLSNEEFNALEVKKV